MVFLLSILAGKSFLTVYANEDKEVSRISESHSVIDWQCYKEGKDIFATDRDYVHSQVTVTLSFGSDFAQLDSSKYKLSNGGEGTKYCKGTREAKFAYTGIIVVVAIILILLIVGALCYKKKDNFSCVCYPNHTHSNPIPSTICKVT